MARQHTIWVDEQPLARVGLTGSRLAGFLAAPIGERAMAGVPGATGQLIGALQAAPPATGTIVCMARLDALTQREDVIKRVWEAYGGAIRRLRTLDRPGVTTRALLTGCEPTELPQARGLTVPSIIVTLTWLRVDGGSEARHASAPILLGTTPASIPIGSMPSAGHLLAWGYTSPLVITYTPANGLGATALTITQPLDTGEHVHVDLGRGDVWRALAVGGRARVGHVSGTIPALDHGHKLGTQNPRLTMSSGTGLLCSTLRYRI